MYIRAVGASRPPPAHSTARSTPATDRPSSIRRSWYWAAMMPASALSRNPYAVAAATSCHRSQRAYSGVLTGSRSMSSRLKASLARFAPRLSPLAASADPFEVPSGI